MKSKTKSLLSIVVIACIVIFGFLYYKEGTLPVNKSTPKTVMFLIRKGETLTTIAQNLEKADLIRNKIVFFITVRQLGIEKNIQAGDFRLSTDMTPAQIAKKLTQGTEDKWVTIIEGLRKEEIADILASQMSIPEADFLQSAKEGYLFPDTYLIPRAATSDTILTILTNNFNTKYTSDIAARAAKLGLSQNEVITLASIVEKEGRGSDRPLVASVLLRRYRENYPLQADATVQYALGYQSDIKKWWKPVLSVDDLKISSPYNTYKNTGLPPAPICSPGISSIEAVVNADPNTPYMFYLHDKNGKVHPARTADEHEENIKKYL